MDSGSSAIVFCSVADPHLILMTVDGSLIYGKLIQDFTGTRLKLQKAVIDKVGVTIKLQRNSSHLPIDLFPKYVIFMEIHLETTLAST